MARSPKRPVHGILLLDKPLGLSSNQAMQRARQLFQAAKAGHTGSLDPLASGLLPLCFGEATKIAGLLLGSAKAYEARCRLGETTDTDDAEGEIVQRRPLPALDDGALDAVLQRFVGRIEQVPPAYSALKREGVPMYIRARRGEQVDLAPRTVRIHAIELLGRDGADVRLRVECGSGTYIRSLARDLGEALGCGAHLVALRRTWVEPFREPAMHFLEDLQARAETGGMESLDACLLPIEAGLVRWPRVDLDAASAADLGHGRPVATTGVPAGRCVAFGPGGRLLALAEATPDGVLRVQRGFNLPAPRT